MDGPGSGDSVSAMSFAALCQKHGISPSIRELGVKRVGANGTPPMSRSNSRASSVAWSFAGGDDSTTNTPQPSPSKLSHATGFFDEDKASGVDSEGSTGIEFSLPHGTPSRRRSRASRARSTTRPSRSPSPTPAMS